MKTADFIREHNACREGARWALSVSSDMAEVWDAMITQGKYDWLIWTATRPGVFPEPILRKLACRFVRETPVANGRTVWDLLTDERSRKALEMSERYADGKAMKKELVDAAFAADAALADAVDRRYAALAATVAADSAAWDAAYYAAYAASDAAYADACAAASYAAYAAASDAADAAAADAAYAAADAAQIRMVAELGNPFKEENDHENR